MLRQQTIQFMGHHGLEPNAPATSQSVIVNGVQLHVVRFPAAGGANFADGNFRFPFNFSYLGGAYVEIAGTPQLPVNTGTVDFEIGIHTFQDNQLIVQPGTQQTTQINCATAGGYIFMNTTPQSWVDGRRYWTGTGTWAADDWGVVRIKRLGTGSLATGFDLTSLTVHYRVEA